MTAREAGFLDIADRRLEYAVWGPDGAPGVVLLHEGLGSVALWRDLPEELAERTGTAVLAYSRAGYGRSSPCALPRPLDYMTREAVDVLPLVLDAADVGPVVLVGHSDGASIAALHAGHVRDPRLRGICLIAPHFLTEPEGLAAIAEARRAYEAGDLRARLARYHVDVDCAFHGWNGAWLDPGFRSWNITDTLPGITCPVLVVQGDADPYGTLAQIEALHEGCKTDVDTLILPGIGHAPHLEAREPTLDRIARFVRSCLSAARLDGATA